MAVTTERVNVGATWVAIATGSLDVLAQLVSVGTVEIVIAEAAPQPDAAEVGVMLSDRGETVFSATALAATDNVYARSRLAGTETLTVVKSAQQV